MSVIGQNIHFRDLRTLVDFYRPTLQQTWGLIIAYPPLTYWTAGSIGIVIRIPDGFFEETEWQSWYFVYGGNNYYLYQYKVVVDENTTQQFVFFEGRSPSVSDAQIALQLLPTYSSDAEAAAAGLGIGRYYRAGAGHDRADQGSLTSRIE